VSHKVMLSHNLPLSCQALCRSAQVVSLRTSGVAAARRNLGTISILNRKFDLDTCDNATWQPLLPTPEPATSPRQKTSI